MGDPGVHGRAERRSARGDAADAPAPTPPALGEARLRALLEGSSEVVLLSGADGRVQYWSPGATSTLGWTAEEALGRTLAELLHPEDAEGVSPGAPPRPFMARFRHRDGGWRVLEGASRDLLADPSVAAVVTNARDVTAQRRLAEELRHARRSEAIGALAGGVAHDFNNVLAVVNGYAEQAVRELDESDPLFADMRQVLEAGRRGAVLTRQLLAFSRRAALRPEVVSPAEILHELAKLLRRVVGEGVALELATAPGCGRVLADPGLIEQMVVNLVVTAREAAGGRGAIAIECRDAEVDAAWAARHPGAGAGPHVALSVSCRARLDGEVVPLEGRLADGRAARGSGLGAAGVRQLATECGGLLEVEAPAGLGARWSVYLPCAPAGAGAGREEDAASGAAGRATVLFVEDDEPLRTLATRTLARAGYEVLSAGSGEEALAQARRHGHPIDLLVADVVLPGLSGPELARKLGRLQPDLCVLFTSGWPAGSAAVRDALASGAGFLPKPYTGGALVRKAWEVVAASRAGAAAGAA